jgi:5-(carboxyamino)imidazole ribonucleotide synthase
MLNNKSKPFYHQKIGIIGGGQLGKMLAMAAAPWSIAITVLDKEPLSSARGYTHEHLEGDPLNYDDILKLGLSQDIITIEMENVNVEALLELQRLGKKVCPSPEILRIIQDKGEQKHFFSKHHLPSSEFEVFENLQDLLNAINLQRWVFPFVVKSCRAGYDGKGVFVIHDPKDLIGLPENRYLIERKVDLAQELSVIVARNAQGECKAYPVCELHVHPQAHLLSHMTCPAQISEELQQKATALALQTIQAFELEGIMAVEFFVDQNGQLWLNEVSPRPHNTGHHTIEACITSQYEQHLRAILNCPLGFTETFFHSAVVNVLGPEGMSGSPVYHGLDQLLAFKGVVPHIYGKKKSQPHRKLGHVTILADSPENLQILLDKVQKTLYITVI